MQYLLEIVTGMALSGELQETSIVNDDNDVIHTQFFNFSELNIEGLKVEEDKIAL
jgi:hypothetical protein